MECLRITLRPLSAFGGPIRGDTLFGHLCWAARNRWGDERLRELLDGYTSGRPFAVCSDAFPAGHLPRPALPLHRFAALPEEDRKAVKRRRWLPREALAQPVRDWLAACRSEPEVLQALGGTADGALSRDPRPAPQQHQPALRHHRRERLRPLHPEPALVRRGGTAGVLPAGRHVPGSPARTRAACWPTSASPATGATPASGSASSPSRAWSLATCPASPGPMPASPSPPARRRVSASTRRGATTRSSPASAATGTVRCTPAGRSRPRC